MNVELVCRQNEVDEYGDVWNSVEIFYEEFTNGKHIGRYCETAKGWELVPPRRTNYKPSTKNK